MKIDTKSLLGIAAVFASFSTAQPAYAFDWYTDAKVMVVESDYMPKSIAFTINTTGGPCTAGQFLSYYAQGTNNDDRSANTQATLALLLTAAATGQTVTVYGFTNCGIEHVWIKSGN